MTFVPFTYDRHLKFLLDTLRVSLPQTDLSTGSFWQIWAQGQARGLAGVTAGLNHTMRQILPDQAVGLDLDHHASVYDLPRLPPTRTRGRVKGTALAPFQFVPGPYSGLHLVATGGRRYDIDDIDQFAVPFAGSFEISVTAREAGANAGQGEDIPLTFVCDPPPPAGDPPIPAELDAEVRVLAPGLMGGRDLESDAALQARIVSTLSAGRLKDGPTDYSAWVLASPTFTDDGRRCVVTQVWVYRDQLATNRVYLLPLAAPPERIGPDGFAQTVFNAVESRLPVTVDPIVPTIRAAQIAVTLTVAPKTQGRWDWYGYKRVDGFQPSDREIVLVKGTVTEDPGVELDGADGLRPGMRVLIGGEPREIGHVDHQNHKITLTRDLSTIPADHAKVYPAGPVTEPVQAAIRQLFSAVTPIHMAALGDLRPHEVLAAAITDAVMELPEVHDVRVENPQALFSAVPLDDPAFRRGTLAFLAIPGALTVVPWSDF